VSLPRLNWPNRITLSRLLCSVGLFTLLALMPHQDLAGSGTWGWVAFFLFVLTAATDWLDGWLARRLGEVTVFGRIMDPFVDKVVVCGSLILLMDRWPANEILLPWMVVVVVAREFFVNAIRGFMESRGLSFAAAFAGKLKMTLQCIATGGLILMIATSGSGSPPGWLRVLTVISLWAAVVSTVYSGWLYLRKAVDGLRDSRI
jgi:CDP-diacylglycerol--glycerol-3-phosphate 3-phosphatidyltransferase